MHSCVALLEQWEPSAGVAMEMETLLRWTPSPGPAPQRERQPGSSQQPHGSVPSASRTCRHLSFLRIILIPVPLPSSQDAIPLGVDFSPAPAAGAGSSSPWTRPAAHVGCHSALGTRGHLGRDSMRSQCFFPHCELGNPKRGEP